MFVWSSVALKFIQNSVQSANTIWLHLGLGMDWRHFATAKGLHFILSIDLKALPSCCP